MPDKGYCELKAKASAPVTQGKWRELLQKDGEVWVVGDGRQVCTCQDGRVANAHDAAYIAAASPAVVLDLLADLDRARAENKRLREAATNLRNEHWACCQMIGETATRSAWSVQEMDAALAALEVSNEQ